MSKKTPSPYIKQAENISTQQRTAGQGNIDAASGTVSQFESNPTANPLYKALYSTEAGQMSKAYDMASANQTARARQAGFGYQQPVAQGAEGELRGQEASSIGQLPGQVEQQVAPQVLQGAQIQGGLGTSELQAGNQMYTGGVVPLDQQYQNYRLNYKNPVTQGLAAGLNAAGFGGGLSAGLAQV